MAETSDIPHRELLDDIKAFCLSSGVSKSKFGQDAVKDPRFVFDLEAGRECRRSTVQKVMDYMAGAEAAQ